MNDYSVEEIRDALKYITSEEDVDGYETWLHVGMGLKDGGYPIELWDEWSRTGSKYDGNCAEKWNSFKSEGYTIGTLIALAKKGGWNPPKKTRGVTARTAKGGLILTESMFSHQLEPVKIDTEADPFTQLETYIKALFRPEDHVCICTKVAPNKKGELKPTAGDSSKTAQDYLDLIEKYRSTGDITRVIGKYNTDIGAWIRINPTDGCGGADKNITAFRYTLIEADDIPIEQQANMMHSLKLPIRLMVYSGKRSLHAIVKVDAKDSEEYKKRVRYIHATLEKLGFKPDPNDKNPSRYSRLPGVKRGDAKQTLVEGESGLPSYSDWYSWSYIKVNNFPPVVHYNRIRTTPAKLKPVLINDVLRKGHKMILSGPSKSGKSYALIELAYAIAEGMMWLGNRCTKGKVLYLNMEIDGESFKNRIDKVYQAYGMTTDVSANIDILNLRGFSRPISQMLPLILDTAKQDSYDAIIIDPLYKVMEGDENSNSDIAQMVGCFDQIAMETGASVIYAHHFAKGYAGDRSAIDRAAGAGTFSRDPDAILTMTQLDYEDDIHPGKTAWQVDYVLREFKEHEPTKCFFDFPRHVVDYDGVLDDAEIITSQLVGLKRANAAIAAKAESKRQETENIVSQCHDYGGGILLADFMKVFNKYHPDTPIARTSARRALENIGYAPGSQRVGNQALWSKDFIKNDNSDET